MSWPLSPSNGQQVLINGIVYVYDSANAVWNRVFATTSVGGGITTAVTVTQSSQPNITSVGTMVSLTATGNIQGGNLIGTYANGNSNVAIAANANVTVSVAGNTNVVTVTGTGVNVAGTLNTGAGNANVGNLGVITDANIGGNLVLGGNLVVTGTTTTVNSTVTRIVDPIVEQGGGANGALLTSNDSKDRGQLLHYYSSGVVDAFMGWDNSASEFILASNVTVTNDVVSINTYGNLRVSNANLGNLATSNYFTGNGSLLSSITGANVTSQVANSLIAGTVYTNAQPNITSVGTLSSLTVTGAIIGTAGGLRAGNIQDPSGTNTISLASGQVTMIGNLTIGSGGIGNLVATNANLGNLVRANYFAGTLTTAIQPNVTSVGTLASLSVTANIVSGNADLGNTVTANYFTSNSGITANTLNVSGLFTSGETTEVVIGSGALSSTTTNYNFASGATFYHSSVTSGANWTANFQNVPTTDDRSIVITLIVVQGATPYIPAALQIDGSSQTIKWAAGAAPAGTASSVDIFSFAIIRSGGAWVQILGSSSSYS